LTSQFPSYWMPPFNLDSLHLGFCDMGPRFPKWLVGQTNISELYISGARISDNIPVWFWNQSPYLSFLNLSNNQMSGMLPNLSSEYPLYIGTDFSSNQFEGPLPVFPSNTTSLNLSNNKFLGSISVICKIMGGALSFLDLSITYYPGGFLNVLWSGRS